MKAQQAHAGGRVVKDAEGKITNPEYIPLPDTPTTFYQPSAGSSVPI